MDTGPQPIADAAERAQIRRQASVVHVKSLAAAVVLTAAIFFL